MAERHEGQTQIVLIVEDEMLVRLLANDILSDAGYRVLEARDGLEALAVLEIHKDVGILFTDIQMPNLDGLALAQIVRDRWPAIGVVITSGNTRPPDGAIFVPKPYTAAMVLDATQKAMKMARST